MTAIMKKIWIFLLMLSLFCIGDTKADMTESQPSERKTTAGAGSRASSANASLSPAQTNNSPYRRQVYRRKQYSMVAKSLSDEQVADRTVFDPSAEETRRAASARIQMTNSAAALARWKESQKNHTKKFVPSDVFRQFSLVSSSGRVSSFRTCGRRRSSVHVRRTSCRRTRTCRSCR